MISSTAMVTRPGLMALHTRVTTSKGAVMAKVNSSTKPTRVRTRETLITTNLKVKVPKSGQTLSGTMACGTTTRWKAMAASNVRMDASTRATLKKT